MPKFTTAAFAAVLSLGLAAAFTGPAAAQQQPRTNKAEQAEQATPTGKACAGYQKGSKEYKSCMRSQSGGTAKRKGHAKQTQ